MPTIIIHQKLYEKRTNINNWKKFKLITITRRRNAAQSIGRSAA